MVNVKEQRLGKNTRKSFSSSKFNLELPNLVEVQTKSFEWFLKEGLSEVLRDVSPITDYSGNLGTIEGITRWQPGKKYRYNITISSEDIIFQVSEIPWIEHNVEL